MKTLQHSECARRHRRRQGRQNPPWSKRTPLSELIRAGDKAGIAKRLDQFADDLADELMEGWL
jgi:hypothetical protein